MGCNTGKDFLQFIAGNNKYEIHGLDKKEKNLNLPDITFHHGFAENMPFPDNYFDVNMTFPE